MATSNITLHPHQSTAVDKMFSGCILYGKVGSGKSFTSLFFYKKYYSDFPLYIITTAKKRDSREWQNDLEVLELEGHIDSWQNINKYGHVTSGFFIFDEQRVTGSGAWVKGFIKISRKNKFVLLSGTPGDVWTDYIPIFVANGFYKNRTEFLVKHAVYDRFAKYPKIIRFMDETTLMSYRKKVLVTMPFTKTTKRNRIYKDVPYDTEMYSYVTKHRWDIFNSKPIQQPSQYSSIIRRLVNMDKRRIAEAGFIIENTKRIIVFYNFDYELDILRLLSSQLGKDIYEWNGHKHDNLPSGKEWVYLVQYMAGAEGWNCITTDTILFYSLNYSYKLTEQAEGRIDRINTPYQVLNYYYLVSSSPIDKSIIKAIKSKKNFNEKAWLGGNYERKQISTTID